MKKDKIVLVGHFENTPKYKILFKFNKSGTNRGFVAYTDFSMDENKKINVYYGTYENEDLSNVRAIENEEEIKMMDELLYYFKFE